MKSKIKGFSLIELLVVIALFSIIGVIVAQSSITTFRGAKKTDSDAKLRENIDYAMSIMERHLRSAVSVTCVSSTQVDFIDQNNNLGRFLLNTAGTDTYIASYSALPAPATQRITSQELTISNLIFTCPVSASPNVAPVVDVGITALDRNAQGTDRSQITTSAKIILRTNY